MNISVKTVREIKSAVDQAKNSSFYPLTFDPRQYLSARSVEKVNEYLKAGDLNQSFNEACVSLALLPIN